MKKAIGSLLTAASIALAQQVPLTPDAARKLGEEVYIYGYPLVLMHVTAESALRSRGAARNELRHLRSFATHEFRILVRPNVDTLNSGAWLDLSKEPVVLHVPDTRGRYYVLQLLDGWTETFASLGKRTTGTRAADFVITGPGWKGRLPRNATRIEAPTNFVWLLLRIQTIGAADHPNVRALQDAFSLRVLSAEERPRMQAEPQASGVDLTAAPPVLVDRMDASDFFRMLAEAMKSSQPRPGDEPMLPKLAQIGIQAGKSFDERNLQPEIREAAGPGVEDARAKIANGRKQLAQLAEPLGGSWTTLRIGVYGTDYFKRSFIARVGLGALPPEDATYASTHVDSERRPLSGAYRYEMRFGKGELPPVRAFWSITLYDQDGYLVRNAINRYSIADRDGLHRDNDGSLAIYIQRELPPDKEANWLPAPSGPFNLALRLYWPGEEILSRTWNAPPVRRID